MSTKQTVSELIIDRMIKATTGEFAGYFEIARDVPDTDVEGNDYLRREVFCTTTKEEYAELIVRAVNSRDELLAVCEGTLDVLNSIPGNTAMNWEKYRKGREMLISIIAKAKGE